jgi:hypothetical protein
MNTRRLRSALKYLRENPDKHNQGSWHYCGTAHCLAGLGQLRKHRIRNPLKLIYSSGEEENRGTVLVKKAPDSGVAFQCDTEHTSFVEGIRLTKDGDYHDAQMDGQEYFGLTYEQADYLFHFLRTLDEMEEFVDDGGVFL